MLGLGRSKPIAEHEAKDETERVYHEIRQTLRVTGVNLNFRSWARFEHFFPAMWDAVRDAAGTRAFEEAADRIRAEAARAVPEMGAVRARESAGLGESQAYQAGAALRLYHYVNPKLLVLTSAVRLALRGEEVGRPRSSSPALVLPGAPAGMYPMEMVDEDTDDEVVAGVFADIRDTLDLPAVNSDYRTLALWPDYLRSAWSALKPVVQGDAHRRAADALRERSRELARDLPVHIRLAPDEVRRRGDDPEEVLSMTERFETLLPGLILNVALLAAEWEEPDALARSPFPAPDARESR